MQRHEIAELHNITLITNVSSVIQKGILSHQLAAKIPHQSIAMPEIQVRRSRIRVPGGYMLHEYVNLYFCARNPMMRKCKDQHKKLCVLRINPDILECREVVITDGNASSGYTAFYKSLEGLEYINHDFVFAEWWTDDNEVEEYKKKRLKCAEVLVPNKIDAGMVMGAYVSGKEGKDQLALQDFARPIKINPHLFFQD